MSAQRLAHDFSWTALSECMAKLEGVVPKDDIPRLFTEMRVLVESAMLEAMMAHIRELRRLDPCSN